MRCRDRKKGGGGCAGGKRHGSNMPGAAFQRDLTVALIFFYSLPDGKKLKKRENFLCQPKGGIVFSEKIGYPEIWKRCHENTCYLPDKGLV